MNKDEIKKALRCCSGDALNIITEQEKEIERLKGECNQQACEYLEHGRFRQDRRTIKGVREMNEYKKLTNNNADEYDLEYDLEYDFCIGCKYFGEPNGCNRPNGTCDNYERFMFKHILGYKI